MCRAIFTLQPSRLFKLQLVMTNITILISSLVLMLGLGTPIGSVAGFILLIATIYRVIIGLYKYHVYEKKTLN
ncbi:hypothetical protein C9I99_13105 [Photobacterium lutimaris]|uniref:Uncharacterized protein n=1 Tax=Photobacterium lutimaris TaxID=388278 RepID=A0A2T3IYM3_9GAMM|nr:hypothetical protein C9I99_13105 [Photobacterium lutimaris]TDR74445.1 hypothetical protein DFP78_10732 [Photobacterium lutimaris]